MSIEFHLEHNVLWITITAQVHKSTLVQETYQRLQVMLQEGVLTGGAWIGINGACPLVVGYAIAEVLCPLYQTVAVYDPKLPGYVIVKSETDPGHLGSLISLPHCRGSGALHSVKVVLCGAPRTGKSCLMEGLKLSLQRLYRQQRGPYPLVIDAAPDGEGSWFQATMARYPELAAALKQRYRGNFTQAFTEIMGDAIAGYPLPLTLIDIGGRISDENRRIVRGATHAIILWRDRLPEAEESPFYASLAEWEGFCAQMGLSVIAKLQSQRTAVADRIDRTEPVLAGVIHGLRRGGDASGYACVRALTERILDLCNSDDK